MKKSTLGVAAAALVAGLALSAPALADSGDSGGNGGNGGNGPQTAVPEPVTQIEVGPADEDEVGPDPCSIEGVPAPETPAEDPEVAGKDTIVAAPAPTDGPGTPADQCTEGEELQAHPVTED